MALLNYYFCLYSGIVLVSCATFIDGYLYSFQFTGEGGTIKSPHYPANYPMNITCIWSLVARSPIAEQRIQLTFNDFHLEKNKKCVYDFIQIREFNPSNGRPISMSPRYCGTNAPPTYVSTTDKIELRFVSDPHGDVYKGFKAVWKVISKTDKNTVPSAKPTLRTTKSPSTPIPTTKSTTPKYITKPCPTVRTIVVTKIVYKCPTTAIPTTTKCHCPKTAKRDSNDIIKTTAADASPTPMSKTNCINSVSQERKGMSKDGNESLAITFGCLLFVLIITNIALVVILCKKERRLDCSLTQMKLWITRKSAQPSSPHIYIPSNPRPTLRMIDGDIVILSSEEYSPQNTPPPKDNGTNYSGTIATCNGSTHNTHNRNSIPRCNSRNSNNANNSSYFDIKNFGNRSTHSGDLTLHSQQSQPSSTLLSVAMSSRSRKSEAYFEEEEDDDEAEIKSINTACISDGSESDY